MPIQTLDTRTALVLIDLQKGITAMPTVHSAEGVIEQAAAMARAFRARELPVVRVRVAFSADGGDVIRSRVDAPPPAITRGPDWAELREEIGTGPHDIIITKRQWDAFFGTELDLQLRRRKMTGIVLAGISTSIGVESTARHGRELGYEIAIASDAVTDTVQAAHENSLQRIFPRLGQIDTTAAIIQAIGRSA
ncbi:MAG TPA: isochorismatase family protein [Gemmatimonadaceae bacterium]